MNADEGEAAGLFAVKKDSDFTDLLLRAVTDTRDTDGLADLVGGFGNKLGRRAELIAERDFTAGSVDLLGRIVEATEARARARDIHTAAERRTRTLARRLSARGARSGFGRATSPSGSPPPPTPSPCRVRPGPQRPRRRRTRLPPRIVGTDRRGEVRRGAEA